MNYHQTNQAVEDLHNRLARLAELDGANAAWAAAWRPSASTRYAVIGDTVDPKFVVAWDFGGLGEGGVHVLYVRSTEPTRSLSGKVMSRGSYHHLPTGHEAEFRRFLAAGREVPDEHEIWTGTQLIAVCDLLAS